MCTSRVSESGFTSEQRKKLYTDDASRQFYDIYMQCSAKHRKAKEMLSHVQATVHQRYAVEVLVILMKHVPFFSYMYTCVPHYLPCKTSLKQDDFFII